MTVDSFRNSQLFKALPFHTSDFLDNDGAINAFKEHESRLAGLCDAVLGFDTSVKTLTSGDANFMKLLYFKNWFLPDTDVGEAGPNKQSEAYAIEAILAHRLLETARIVYDPQPSAAEVVKPTTDPVELMKAQKTGHIPKIDDAIEAFRSGPMKHMESKSDGDVALNVFEVCKEAKALLTSHWESKGLFELQKEESAALDWEDQEVDVRLWKGIAENTAEVEARSILLNVEIAATHIRLLITKKSLHTPLLSELQKKHPACKDLLSKNHFHRSLWIALSISPVFLLRKFDISKMFQLNSHNIFDFWSRFAMSRGDAAFLNLENKIWRMLFEIALGQPTRSALEGLFTDLDKSSPKTRLVIPLAEAGHKEGHRLSKHRKLQKRKANGSAENTPRKKVNRDTGLGKGIQEVGPKKNHRKPSSESLNANGGARDNASIPDDAMVNFEPNDIITKSSRSSAVDRFQDFSEAREGNWSSTSVAETAGLTGHYDEESASIPDYSMDNFEPNDVITESGRSSAVDVLQDLSEARGGNWSSTSVAEKAGLTGHYGEESGSEFRAHCSNPVAASSQLSNGVSNLPATPEQHILNPEPSSDVQMGCVKAAGLDEEEIKGGGEISLAKTSAPTEASKSGFKEVLASVQSHRAMVKKMERRLADSLQVPVFISYVPVRQQEEGWPELSLAENFCSELYQGNTILSCLPKEVIYTPVAHSLLGLERIAQLFKRAKLSHDSGVSCVLTFSRADWSRRSAEDQQHLYSKTELVILPEHYSQPEFDRRLLLSIAGSSQQPIRVYDLSVISAGVNGEQRIGNIDLILVHSKAGSGSILYSLNIPSIGAGASDVSPEEAIATDLCAFQATVLRQYCGFRHPYPSTSMRWSSCGLKHAITPFSWTSEGLGTYFQVVSGRQVLYIAKPASDDHLAELSCFASSDLSQEVTDAAVWEINAQVLEAGSICYIRPCRPYALLNLEHTVCRGGFVYTWSTIQDSCYGIYHSFFSDQDCLGPELSWESRMLLRRMVTYYHMHYAAGVPQTDFPHHLPSLTTFSDIVGLLCLLNIVVLGQTVYPPHYNDPAAMADPYKEQLFTKGRQEAQELLTFLTRTYHLTLENRAVNFWQLFIAYLVLHVRCMVRHAVVSDQAGGPQRACKLNSLVEALSVYFSNKPWFLEELLLQQKRNLGATTYAWKFEEQYSLIRRTNPTIEAGMDLAFPKEVSEEGVARLFKALSKELELNSFLEKPRAVISV